MLFRSPRYPPQAGGTLPADGHPGRLPSRARPVHADRRLSAAGDRESRYMAGRRSFARRPPPGGIVHQSGHDDSGPAIAAVPGNQAWPGRCRPGWSRISQPAEDPGIPSLRQQTPAQIMRTASPSGCKLKLTTNSEVLPPHSHETGSAARASAGPGAAPADLSVRRCCIRTGTVRSVSAGGRSSLLSSLAAGS